MTGEADAILQLALAGVIALILGTILAPFLPINFALVGVILISFAVIGAVIVLAKAVQAIA